MPYDIDQLKAGIVAADKAGDSVAVQKLGAEYRKLQGGASSADKPATVSASLQPAMTKDQARSTVTNELMTKKLGAIPGVATGEAALNMGTGMLAKPISEIAGLAATGYEGLTGGQNPQGPSDFKNYVQNAMTYEPRTTGGKSVAQYNPAALAGEGLGIASNALGGAIGGGEAGDTLSGAAGNFAAEAIPQGLGIAGAKAAPYLGKKVPEVMSGKAKELMQSAIKPLVKDLKNGEAAKAIDTMLNENIPLSKKGVEILREKIDDLNNQIAEAVKKAPGSVRMSEILPMIRDRLDKVNMQANPNADIAATRKAWQEFKEHPLLANKSGQIPVSLAQSLKQGTYRNLREKYGEESAASVEAQKAIARGLKEGVAKNAPEVVELNEKESKLLNALPIVERRVLMDANKNPMGLSLMTTDKAKWAAFMMDRSPSFKSFIARILNNSKEAVGKAAETSSYAPAAANVSRPIQNDQEGE